MTLPAAASHDERHELLPLVKDVVDDLGTLLAGHVRLARVEITDEIGRVGRRLGLVALAGALLFVGYALMCVAGALLLARVIGTPLAFLSVGGVHLVGAGIALPLLLERIGRHEQIRT